MNSITIPRQRNQKAWNNNKPKVEKIQGDYKAKKQLSFAKYCQYSFYYLDAPYDSFYNDGKCDLNILLNPIIKFPDQNKSITREVKQIGTKILNMITYAWENIQKHIEGRKKNEIDKKENIMQIYTEQNIKLHFARLQQMLKELKSKNYRLENFTKQNQFERAIYEKEIKQQITFIKLLKSILQTQTQKIEQKRTEFIKKKSEKNDSSMNQQEQKRWKIMKFDQYFQNKYNKNGNQKDQILNPIEQIEKKRRFNCSALKYYYAIHKNNL